MSSDDSLYSLQLNPDDYLTGRAMPQEMVIALRVIADLDPSEITRIDQYLSALSGVTDEDEVTDGISNVLNTPDLEAASSIFRTLLNVRPRNVAKSIKILNRWRQSSEERQQFFPDDMFLRLTKNLHDLVTDRPSVALVRKANYLLRAVGNELDSIAYYCDMRPVFDKTRRSIDGFVVLANMQIAYRSQDNVQHAFEVALTEDELRDVMTASSEALAKLEVLKATIDTFRHEAEK